MPLPSSARPSAKIMSLKMSASQSPSLSLLSLPPEILVSIFCHLPAQSICSLRSCCSLLCTLSDRPLVWIVRCRLGQILRGWNHNHFHSRAREDYGAKLRAESSPREVYQRLLHRYRYTDRDTETQRHRDTDTDTDTQRHRDTETQTETQTQRYQRLLHRYGKLCGLWQRQNLAPYGGVLKVLLKFSLFPPHFSGRSEGRRDLL